MRDKIAKIGCMVVMLLVIACSSGNEKLIRGKWTLAGRMIGGAPTSYWFKRGGKVIGPWEPHNFATQSEGRYVLLDDSRIKIMMNSGFYEGNTYFFDIKKLDEKELVLINNFQEVKLKRVSEE